MPPCSKGILQRLGHDALISCMNNCKPRELMQIKPTSVLAGDVLPKSEKKKMKEREGSKKL